MTIHIASSGPFVDVMVTGDLTAADLPELFSAFEASQRKGPFVVLTDTLGMASAAPATVTAFADGLRRLPSLKDVWLGDAVVVSSPVARFVLSTLILTSPLPTAMKVFDTRVTAKAWCRSILQRARVLIPEALKERASPVL